MRYFYVAATVYGVPTSMPYVTKSALSEETLKEEFASEHALGEMLGVAPAHKDIVISFFHEFDSESEFKAWNFKKPKKEAAEAEVETTK